MNFIGRDNQIIILFHTKQFKQADITTNMGYNPGARDLLMATADGMKEARAIRPSILDRLRETEERIKCEERLPNNYRAIKERNDKIWNGEYHFEVVEEGEDPNTPWRHTKLVME